MSYKKKNREKYKIKPKPPAAMIVDEATGDALFEQPLVSDGSIPGNVANDQPGESKGGKARARKIGKAKLTAIAERVKRSRPKR
ncbi:MAG TPA: hypothetical protein VGM05_05735 [Planctomycetaceae bacterium]|jgi:hypothetical protein